MNIDLWLKTSHLAWKNHNIDRVLGLFTDKELQYWETPYRLLESKPEIAKEWELIKKQENITYEYSVFSSAKESHAIQFKISYDQDSATKTFAGVYLIKLDSSGKCFYFLMAGEKNV